MDIFKKWATLKEKKKLITFTISSSGKTKENKTVQVKKKKLSVPAGSWTRGSASGALRRLSKVIF